MSAQKEASSLPTPEGTEQSEAESGLDITFLSIISRLLCVGLIFKNTKTSNKTELLAQPRQVSYHILQLSFNSEEKQEEKIPRLQTNTNLSVLWSIVYLSVHRKQKCMVTHGHLLRTVVFKCMWEREREIVCEFVYAA